MEKWPSALIGSDPFYEFAGHFDIGGAQARVDTRTGRSPADHGDVAAQLVPATHTGTSPNIAVIVQLWRQRQAWHRAEKALNLQAQARCRAFAEGDKDEAGKLWKRAQDSDETLNMALRIVLDPFLSSIGHFVERRGPIEKQLRKLARATPYWTFAEKVRGFGDLNLAALVGECGDIAGYRNPSCLWKRMGLAVIDGGRQRKIADAEAALIHGYNPSRRAVAFLLGECLIKANSPYKAIYDERKAFRLGQEGWTKVHAHRDAARFMVKRVLRDLWIATQDARCSA